MRWTSRRALALITTGALAASAFITTVVVTAGPTEFADVSPGAAVNAAPITNTSPGAGSHRTTRHRTGDRSFSVVR